MCTVCDKEMPTYSQMPTGNKTVSIYLYILYPDKHICL